MSKNVALKSKATDAEIGVLDEIRFLCSMELSSLPMLEAVCAQIHPRVLQLHVLQQSQDLPHQIPIAERLANLSAWLKKEAPDCGIGQNFGFTANVVEGGCGVIAKRDMAVGTEFIKIPRKIMLTTETAIRSKYGAFYAQDALCRANASIMLSLHLALERHNPQSPFAAYIASLPLTPSVPLLYTSDELALLKGTSLYPQVLSLHRNTARNYVYLITQRKASLARVPDIRLSMADFMWAVAIIMSRQNQIFDKKQNPQMALIPGWDMCNYRPSSMVSQYDAELDRLTCATTQHVSANEQIYIHYGDRSNHQIFLFMGFLCVDNITNDPSLINSFLDPRDQASLKLTLRDNQRYVEQAYDPERVRVHAFDEQCGDCVRNLQNAAIDVEHMHVHSDQCSHDHLESKNMASVDSTAHVHSDQCRHGSKSDHDVKASPVTSEHSHSHSVPPKSQPLSQPHGTPASMASLASEVMKAAGPPAPECLGDARDSLFRFRKMLLAKRAMKPEEDLDLNMAAGTSLHWTKATEFAKIAVANKAEASTIMTSPDNSIISGRLEQLVYLFLGDAAASNLAEFPSTIEEDLQILARKNVSINALMAIQFRLLEKQVLFSLSTKMKMAAAHVDDYHTEDDTEVYHSDRV